MNRRDALRLFGLAPVAGVMAARDAMAAPAASRGVAMKWESLVVGRPSDFIVTEHVGESTFITPNQARKILGSPDEIFGVDGGGQDDKFAVARIETRPAADESVSAQFESDLEFIRDEPGVVS